MSRILGLLVAGTCLVALPALGQSMSPMRGEIRSFTESFAVRVYPRNPYRHRIKVAIRVYDAEFRPVEARVRPPVVALGAGGSRSVLVVVNFHGEREKRVRICAESIPIPGKNFGMKVQICGKFIAHRL